MIFDLFEEHLDLPAAAIEFGHTAGGPGEVVGQENHFPFHSIDLDQRDHSTQADRITAKAEGAGQFDLVVFEKLATLQLLDVRVPTTDSRELLLVRRTEPDRDVVLLLARLNLTLPPQAPPRISAAKLN